MAEYINPPTISFVLTSQEAAIATILALLENELQTLTSDELVPGIDGTVDLSQRVSGRIIVELIIVDSDTETTVSSASLSALPEAAACRGVINLSLNVQRCTDILSQDLCKGVIGQ